MNRKLRLAHNLYLMADRIKARAYKAECEGWAEKRNRYDAYIASITTPEQRRQWAVHRDMQQAVSEACSV